MFKETIKSHLSWGTFFVGGYIALVYVTGITRYKNLFFALMVLTALYFLIKNPKGCLSALKNNIILTLGILTLAYLYSIVISPDPKLSFSEIKTPFFRDVVLSGIIITLALSHTDTVKIQKMIIGSFLLGLLFITLKEMYLFYLDYQNNIMPFTNYNHRSVSDGIVFFFPALVALWHFQKPQNYVRLALTILLILSVLFVLLGTLSRGAWLAVFVMFFMMIIMNKNWKTFIVSIVFICAAIFAIKSDYLIKGSALTYKLEQTDSSHRYSNGTQGSALTLILEHPLKGYGAGNKIYDQIYNESAKNYPDWIYQTSLGPHNIFLTVWFSAGILGMGAFLFLIFSYLKQSAQEWNTSIGDSKQAGLILLISFFGYFIVRGNFESVHLNILGIYLGLLAALCQKRWNEA
ncbi:O-antigen ligase RfaL [Xenorhabdus griffiniae]|uniref:O-antigen ligase RfaL n=1 Tax=Xenorhabdus griffiniae TaxID=351672 RepID=A0ABY9XHW1_9GAMM|nr:O-antigen ligase RfaL [Xenorhabdus griffiniae]MBD1228162.1 O-antigen ligase RfaL [Xenorhabdus griffiniae]MBE8587936.1 O-antigen ligase RfaL [Xenorhabdus griffiniae]WMV72399.1 O-antigen ligase RfaL [Xenorhabdus griffiniae]WNH02077.1 O-antigen ligase RfaL [Xenorhabdus griffiniae]